MISYIKLERDTVFDLLEDEALIELVHDGDSEALDYLIKNTEIL